MNENTRKRIFGMSRQLGISNAELHLLVYGVTGKDSIKELDGKDAYAVIGELDNRIKLSGKGLKGSAAAENKEEVSPAGMMTARQKKMAWALMYRLQELDPREASVCERLCGAINRILGITVTKNAKDPLVWVSFDNGKKLIEQLKRYVRTEEKKTERKAAAN